MRTDSLLALLWNPIDMGLKTLYVLDIMVFEDSPLIQLFLAISIQIAGLIIFAHIQPLDEK